MLLSAFFCFNFPKPQVMEKGFCVDGEPEHFATSCI